MARQQDKTAANTKNSEGRDLTSMLMANNLNQLNISGAKTTPANFGGSTSSTWNTSINQTQRVSMNAVSPMSMKSSTIMPWNTIGMGASMNSGSQLTSPVNNMTNWSSAQPTHSIPFNQKINDRTSGVGAVNSMTMPMNFESSMNTQQNKPVSLSTQDIIDFLS